MARRARRRYHLLQPARGSLTIAENTDRAAPRLLARCRCSLALPVHGGSDAHVMEPHQKLYTSRCTLIILIHPRLSPLSHCHRGRGRATTSSARLHDGRKSPGRRPRCAYAAMCTRGHRFQCLLKTMLFCKMTIQYTESKLHSRAGDGQAHDHLLHEGPREEVEGYAECDGEGQRGQSALVEGQE